MLLPLEKLCPGVKPTVDALVYEVKSSSRPMDHRVDLAAWSGYGACDCEHFTCKLGPAFREKILFPNEEIECQHIRKARRYLAIEIAQATIKARFGENLDKYDQELPQG